MSFNSSISLDSSVSLICFKYKTPILMLMSFVITYILLLFPLFFLILYVGLQQWRKQRSRSTAPAMSHSDFFTFNVIGLEVINIVGLSLYCYGAYVEGLTVQIVGLSMYSIASPGQTLFHLLTCVERYLAVIHPIIYVGLRQAGWVRIRNVSAGCIWLLCVGLDGISKLFNSTFSPITNSCLMVFSLILLFFCSFFVLRVLNHPGPGEVSGDREQVDQSKQRAFHTILVITITLLLRFVGFLTGSMVFTSLDLTHTKCLVGSTAIWLNVPCSLMLPLLYLQRAGKIPSCKCNAKSG